MKTYRTKFIIPNYLVQGFGDDGMHHEEDSKGNVDTDDLRVSIKLSGGLGILIDGLNGKPRLIIDEYYIHVQYLADVDNG